MIRDGLIDEVKALLKKYDADVPAFNAIGYREVIAYLNGELSLESALSKIKINTWQYAKRQVTWLRRYGGVRWVDATEDALACIRI